VTQIHDYDPGITKSGLFWTIAVPDEAVEADVEDAEARMRMSNLSISDYGSIPNGLFHFDPPARGKVSFDLRWSGAKKKGSFSDPSLPFQMDFVQTGAHLSWSGRTGADTFHSTDGKQTVNFAQIANARNGSFFDEGDDDGDRQH
jgi:hypothetical protein